MAEKQETQSAAADAGTDDTATENDAAEGSIDYSKSQSAIDKAKAKAHDADSKRLAEEHASKA